MKLHTSPLSRNKRKLESLEKNNGRSPLRRSVSGGESLRSGSSSFKQCLEHNVLKMDEEKNRKKIKLLSQVTMESGKAKAHPEQCVMKRKRMIDRSFKALFRGKCVQKTLSGELPLAQSDKHPSDKRTEEQVISVDSTKQHLKRIHTQGSQNTIDSCGDQLSTEEDINQETSNVDGQRLLSSSLQLTNVKVKIENNSAKQDHGEDQILLQQKHAVKDKDSGSRIDSLINKIQKKCHNRMRKLNQKQQAEIQEFHRTWDKKRLDMERDHKLELAVIRSIHGGGSSVRSQDRIKLLDGKFAEKIEEHNLLKDMQLKELEAKQLAARNEETQKKAHWLAKANACRSSGIRAVYGQQSHGLQSEDVSGFSQASAHIHGAEDIMPLTRHHMEDNNPSKSVQGNDVSLSEKSVGAPAQGVGCNVSMGNSSNFISTDLPKEIGVAFSQRSILAGVEQLNQPKAFGTEESVPEIQPVEQNHQVQQEVPDTVRDEIVDFDNPVEKSNNTSNKGVDGTDAICLPDASENQGDELDESPIGGLPLVGDILEPSKQIKSPPYPCALVLPQVSPDQMQPGSISDEIQDQGILVVEIQNTTASEVAASEHIDTLTTLQNSVELQHQDQHNNASAVEDQVASRIEVANLELVVNSVNPVQDQGTQVIDKQDQDAPNTSRIEVANLDIFNIVTLENSTEKLRDQDASIVEHQVALQIEVVNSEQDGSVNPLQFNVDAPPIEDCVKLRALAIDVSPSYNQPPSIEVESLSQNLERNSSQTVEITDTLVLSDESASQVGENHEPQSMHLGLRSESEVVEPSPSSQNKVALSETSEVELEADLQLGSLDHLYGSSYLFSNPSHQVPSQSYPHMFASPLQHYLKTICEEIKQLQKYHEDKMSQLKADREKEIQETLAQIHNKYDMKVQEAQAELRFKQNRLEKSQRKVHLNNIFAVAFSSSCLGHWSYGLPELLQGTPYSSMQQQPLQHSLDHPSPRQLTSVSNLQGMQQLLPPCSTIHNSVTASPVQVAQHAAAALSFGSISQPPAISAITPITPMANPCFGGEFRSQALHLQSRAASSTPTTTFPSVPQYSRQLRPSQPLQSFPTAMPPQHRSSTFRNRPQHQSVPPAMPPQHRSSTFQNRPQHQSVPPAVVIPSLSLSELEYLIDVSERTHLHGGPVSSNVPEMCSNFDSLEQSDLVTHGNMQGNRTSSAGATDAICLSDDD